MVSAPLSNKPKEKDIQRAILEYLHLRGYFCWRNNTGARSDTYKGRKRFFKFGKVGSGDIIGLTKDGRFFSIEIKAPGNLPTSAQCDFMDEVTKNMGLAFSANCLETVQKYL